MITLPDIDEDVPSIDPTTVLEQTARLLHATAVRLYGATIASRSEADKELFEWMHHPELGDWVFVHFASLRQPPLDLIGKWVGSWTYFSEPDTGQDEMTPFRNRGIDVVDYLEKLDGDFIKWGNCKFLRLPMNPWGEPHAQLP